MVHIEPENYYFVGFDKENKKIDCLLLGDCLGEGSFTSVSQIKNIFTHTQEAIREASFSYPKALEDVKHAYQLLIDLHREGQLLGILPPSRCLAKFEINADQSSLGSIEEKFDTNYFKYLGFDKTPIPKPLSYQERLSEIHQMLGGVALLHHLNCVHGDLKPENILVHQKTQRVVIADFGGASRTDRSTDIHQLKGNSSSRAFSPRYSLRNELILVDQLANEGHYDKLVELEQKRDVFSMGCILYEILSYQSPFLSRDPDDFPLAHSYHPLKATVPKELKDLVQEMLHPDYKQRPSSQQVFERYRDFLEENHPKELLHINQRIFKDYAGASFTLF